MPLILPESARFCLKMPESVLWEWPKVPDAQESPRNKKHKFIFNDRGKGMGESEGARAGGALFHSKSQGGGSRWRGGGGGAGRVCGKFGGGGVNLFFSGPAFPPSFYWGKALLLTVGGFLLTVELFVAYCPLRCLLAGVSHCKHESSKCKQKSSNSK